MYETSSQTTSSRQGAKIEEEVQALIDFLFQSICNEIFVKCFFLTGRCLITVYVRNRLVQLIMTNIFILMSLFQSKAFWWTKTKRCTLLLKTLKYKTRWLQWKRDPDPSSESDTLDLRFACLALMKSGSLGSKEELLSASFSNHTYTPPESGGTAPIFYSYGIRHDDYSLWQQQSVAEYRSMLCFPMTSSLFGSIIKRGPPTIWQ